MFDGRVDGLYIILISLHGLVRGDKMELGKDADTGGQVCGDFCWQPSAPGGDVGRLRSCPCKWDLGSNWWQRLKQPGGCLACLAQGNQMEMSKGADIGEWGCIGGNDALGL